jgi:hypothetical protein
MVINRDGAVAVGMQLLRLPLALARRF